MRVVSRFNGAKVLLAKIEARETLGSSQENLTEEEIVEKAKATAEERRATRLIRTEEARADAAQEKELKNKMEKLCDTLQEELIHGREQEERLFLLLEALAKKSK